MKTHNIVPRFILLLLVIFISSCIQSTTDAQPSFIKTPVEQASETLQPPVTTVMPTTLSNSTIAPTLSIDDANERLLDLLANNNGCQLPCLWGITPGKSPEREAQSILMPLEGISDLGSFGSGRGSVFPNYMDGDLQLITNTRYLSSNQVVSRIAFQAQILKKVITSNGDPGFLEVIDLTPLSKNLEFYMLPNILSQLGIPTSVVISTLADTPNPLAYGGFDVVLIYPDQGVFAHYTTKRQIIGETAQGCFANPFVELELFPSGDRELFSDGLDTTVWANMWPEPVDTPRWKTLETATSMSLEEFYETFREPSDKCIETPVNLWPTQEP